MDFRELNKLYQLEGFLPFCSDVHLQRLTLLQKQYKLPRSIYQHYFIQLLLNN